MSSPPPIPPHLKPGWQTSEAWFTLAMIAAPFIAAAGDLDGWQAVAALGIAGAVAIAYIVTRGRTKIPPSALLAFLLPGIASAEEANAVADSDFAVWIVTFLAALTVLGLFAICLSQLLIRRTREEERRDPTRRRSHPFIGIVLLLPLAAPGCHASPKVVAATATIATVQSIGAGIDAFRDWAVAEERAIGESAVAECSGKEPRAAYFACTASVAGPRRQRIDRVTEAIRIYRAALAIGSDVASGDVAKLGADVILALASVGIRVEVR